MEGPFQGKRELSRITIQKINICWVRQHLLQIQKFYLISENPHILHDIWDHCLDDFIRFILHGVSVFSSPPELDKHKENNFLLLFTGGQISQGFPQAFPREQQQDERLTPTPISVLQDKLPSPLGPYFR